jgi:DNA-binding transcriptional LysR family regulator
MSLPITIAAHAVFAVLDAVTSQSFALAELQGQPFVNREVGSTTRLAFEGALKEKGITVSPIMEMGSREAVWLAVERGIGIGVVSDVEFNPHPNLRAISISDANIYTTAHITCLVDRIDASIIKKFFEVAESIPSSHRVSNFPPLF